MKRFALLVLLLGGAIIWSGAVPARSVAQPQPANTPSVFEVTPSRVYNNLDTEITISGVGFVATPVVTITQGNGKPVVLANPQLVSSTTLKATVPAATPEGCYRLTVYNPDGSKSSDPPVSLTVVRPGDARLRGWAEARPMDSAHTGFAAVVAAGSLYTLGGFTSEMGHAESSVMRAAIGPDGALGPWQSASPLNTPRGAHVALAVRDYIYVLGGGMGAGFPTESSIERAKVNPDGSLTPWEYAGHLPEIRYQGAAVAVGDNLLVIDGEAGWGPGYTPGDTIRAKVAADGSLGPWVTVAGTAGQSRYAAAFGSTIFALNEDGTIERSSMRPDGTLDPWIRVPATAVTHKFGALAVMNSSLLVLGGQGGSYPDQYSLTSVERAAIQADGSLGEWDFAPSMLSGHASFSALASADRLYALGDGTSIQGSKAVEFTRASPLQLSEQLYLPLLRR